jgi:hypothetical protein
MDAERRIAGESLRVAWNLRTGPILPVFRRGDPAARGTTQGAKIANIAKAATRRFGALTHYCSTDLAPSGWHFGANGNEKTRLK